MTKGFVRAKTESDSVDWLFSYGEVVKNWEIVKR